MTQEHPTSLGTSDADTITLLGQNLAGDLMGKVGFGELTFWMVTQRRPTHWSNGTARTPGHRRVVGGRARQRDTQRHLRRAVAAVGGR